jgi:DNA polymerase III delta prime subunit
MNKNSHFIWNEKYRPDTLENYICADDIKAKIKEMIDSQNIGHILLAGKAGSGKTTLAKLLVKNIDCDYLYINATDERSIDVMRDKVGAFASASSFKPIKIVILDEATHILQASQVLLLNMMETFSLKTRFILTGNYAERLIDPLRSRCTEFTLTPPSKSLIAKHVSHILNEENVKHDIKDLAFIINKFYPDFRRIINNCQKYTTNNELVVNQDEIISDSDYFSKILIELKKPSTKSFNNIRQIIANSGSLEFDNIYRQLFEKLSEYSKGNEGEVIMAIEEYQFHSNFRIDQEINIMSLLAKILTIIK